MSQLVNKKVNVHKFGGSSLANVNRLNNVMNIIQQRTQAQDFIIVSANGNITDLLVEFCQGQSSALEQIRDYYKILVPELLEESKTWFNFFNESINQLAKNRSETSFSDETILAHGELWSANLLVSLLNQNEIPAEFIDARKIFKTGFIDNYKAFDKDYFLNGILNAEENNLHKRFIVTGFIAKNLAGQIVTLGRNGSDYSASLLASLANAKSVNLWTDVNGIYSADPRLIEQAYKIDFLSYDEARALASVGTNVLHQKTIGPLVEQKIPLNIYSSFEPSSHGSSIGVMINDKSENATIENRNEVRSIALKENLVEIVIESTLSFDRKELFHELFEKHINATIHQRESFNESVVLLISYEELSLVEALLKEKEIKYHVLAQNIALIAIIGLDEASNQQLANSLKTHFGSVVNSFCHFTQQERVLNFLTKDIDAKNLLSEVYRFCFKAKLSPVRDCHSVN